MHDVTGHGHDLFAAEEPRWEVSGHVDVQLAQAWDVSGDLTLHQYGRM